MNTSPYLTQSAPEMLEAELAADPGMSPEQALAAAFGKWTDAWDEEASAWEKRCAAERFRDDNAVGYYEYQDAGIGSCLKVDG